MLTQSHKFVLTALLITNMTNKSLQLRLYISGKAPNSIMALKNLQTICEAYFHDNYEIEIIDLFVYPLRAIDDGVMLTPMLVTLSSPPIYIIGNLSDAQDVVSLLMSAQR